MPYSYLLIFCLQSVLVHSQVFPRQYFFPNETDLVAVNGSSSTGRCSSFNHSIIRQTCLTPTSSVLFDGNVPTLTGLDGDMWASQLITINTTANTAEITFDFTATPNYTGVGRVEVVMFNCPEWRISVRTISLFHATSTTGSRTFLTVISPTTTSCDSLVRVCLSSIVNSIRPVLTLVFTSPSTSNWVHLAEVTFYTSGSTCPPDTIITPPPPPPPPPTTPPPPITLLPPTAPSTPPPRTPPSPLTTPLPTAPPTTQSTKTEVTTIICHSTTSTPYNTNKSEVCPSSFTNTILASVLTAIITALLTTVISVLVQIALCKYHKKFTSGEAETTGGEGQVYEEVCGIDGGVAVRSGKGVSDPTYMEVEVGGGNTFRLKENEAYATYK